MRPICDIPWEELAVGYRVQATTVAAKIEGEIIELHSGEKIKVRWFDNSPTEEYHHFILKAVWLDDPHVGPWEPRYYPPSFHA